MEYLTEKRDNWYKKGYSLTGILRSEIDKAGRTFMTMRLLSSFEIIHGAIDAEATPYDLIENPGR